ncbi:hypothetical protein AKJ16_DCAP05441 [Drosera capensis]
MMRN